MKSFRLLAALILLPSIALGWWNADWKQRTAVSLNTSSAGVSIQEALTNVVVPLRLHSGNFDFLGAKPDGSDLRVVAGDDKTQLKFWVERFDAVNEIAVVWVQIPSLLPATDKNTVYVYAGTDKAAGDANGSGEPASVADASTLAVFNFAEKDGIAADQTGTFKASAAIPVEVNGLIGQSARISGTPIVWPANDKFAFAADAPLTISMWVRPDAAAGILYNQGPLKLALAAGRLAVVLGSVSVDAGTVAAATWTQIVCTISEGKLTVYVDGAQAGQGDLKRPIPAIGGEIHLGEGYRGLVDELDLATVARSSDRIKLQYAAESADAKLIATKTETSDTVASSGSTSYFGVLFKSLTPDAWTIIAILGVMFLIAVAVMISKAFYVSRTDSANQRFLKEFRDSDDLLTLDESPDVAKFGDSSLYRLYQAGLRELAKRNIGDDDSVLSNAMLSAVKATIDADSVREGYALNSQMVLLTIAIAGGPFLGLLGTVVGVMITFASIAAAGDVNVNAIAPGIAAALLATVAGLSVAIPSLFGYNYLASRIKTIASDMQIFVDEFVTRLAETYGAP